MNFFKRLNLHKSVRRELYKLRRLVMREPRYQIDVGLIEPLRQIAEREQRRPDELALAILEDALKEYESQDLNWLVWQKLSPREQQVAALVCQRRGTREIAAVLGLGETTVLTYVDHILRKFSVANRKELQQQLKGWDFSKWV